MVILTNVCSSEARRTHRVYVYSTDFLFITNSHEQHIVEQADTVEIFLLRSWCRNTQVDPGRPSSPRSSMRPHEQGASLASAGDSLEVHSGAH